MEGKEGLEGKIKSQNQNRARDYKDGEATMETDGMEGLDKEGRYTCIKKALDVLSAFSKRDYMISITV